MRKYIATWMAFFFFASWLVGCAPTHNEGEIVAGMNTYDRLIQKMDVDSIAILYAPDGELGEVAKGTDSIRRFLKKFSDFKVLSNKSTTDSVQVVGDSALQKGTYTQVTVLPSKDTARLTGKFEAHWIWQQNGWRIKKMITKPTQ